ncbi:hypothetical protein [Mycobacterium sp. 852013-50091_SCH5140682]|uniref:hypothetical protein n=1 Tax=Mycobacterium sp. 852013-50091_SCH5140682 TaxID=1834109 RepID=UPI0012EA939E|nr:hypothetical protein [Mycobacterium sp. 852013-50091_SCH5140682]
MTGADDPGAGAAGSAVPHPYEWHEQYPYDGPQHPPTPAPGQSQGVLAVRIVAAVLGGTAAVPWLLMVWMVLSSAFSTNPAQDPHGYGMIFGFLAYLPLSLVCAVLLPLALPKRLWWRGFAVSAVLLFGITGLLILAIDQA